MLDCCQPNGGYGRLLLRLAGRRAEAPWGGRVTAPADGVATMRIARRSKTSKAFPEGKNCRYRTRRFTYYVPVEQCMASEAQGVIWDLRDYNHSKHNGVSPAKRPAIVPLKWKPNPSVGSVENAVSQVDDLLRGGARIPDTRTAAVSAR